MIKIGEYQELEVSRDMPQGYYMIDLDVSEEILLPKALIETRHDEGDVLRLFVYCDSEG